MPPPPFCTRSHTMSASAKVCRYSQGVIQGHYNYRLVTNKISTPHWVTSIQSMILSVMRE